MISNDGTSTPAKTVPGTWKLPSEIGAKVRRVGADTWLLAACAGAGGSSVKWRRTGFSMPTLAGATRSPKTPPKALVPKADGVPCKGALDGPAGGGLPLVEPPPAGDPLPPCGLPPFTPGFEPTLGTPLTVGRGGAGHAVGSPVEGEGSADGISEDDGHGEGVTLMGVGGSETGSPPMSTAAPSYVCGMSARAVSEAINSGSAIPAATAAARRRPRELERRRDTTLM